MADFALAYGMKRKMAKGGSVAKLKLSKHHDKNEHLFADDEGTSKQGGLVRSANRSKSWAKDERSSSPSIERSMAKDRMSEARTVASKRLEATKALSPDLEGLAHGGDVDDDMIGRIMKKRCMSEGGIISNTDEDLADFAPNEFDDLVLDDHLEPGPMGSDEIGNHQEDEDRKDIVARIMARRKR